MMQGDPPPNGSESAGDSDAELAPCETESAAGAAAAFDPEIATQLAAIGEDYGRERSRSAMRKALVGPAVSSTAAIGCGLLGGIYVVAGAVLLGVAVVSLVRVWDVLPRSRLLDDGERVKWRFRLQLTAAYAGFCGLILCGLFLASLASAFTHVRPPDSSQPPSQPAGTADSGPDSGAVQSAAKKPGARPAEDRSLAPDAYLEAGLPAWDRPWSGTDMTRAAQVLSALVQNDAGSLPRFQSQRSGLVFTRITATENLDLLRDQSLPVEQRLPEGLAFLEGSNVILKLYLASYSKGATGSTELIEFFGVQLRLWVVMGQLLDAFIPTLDQNDPTYEVRMKGLTKLREGMAMAVAGTLQTLTERPPFNTTDLKRLLASMQETFADILPRLPAGSRKETIIRLQSFRADPKMSDLNPELSELVDLVEPLLENSNSR